MKKLQFSIILALISVPVFGASAPLVAATAETKAASIVWMPEMELSQAADTKAGVATSRRVDLAERFAYMFTNAWFCYLMTGYVKPLETALVQQKEYTSEQLYHARIQIDRMFRHVGDLIALRSKGKEYFEHDVFALKFCETMPKLRELVYNAESLKLVEMRLKESRSLIIQNCERSRSDSFEYTMDALKRQLPKYTSLEPIKIFIKNLDDLKLSLENLTFDASSPENRHKSELGILNLLHDFNRLMIRAIRLSVQTAYAQDDKELVSKAVAQADSLIDEVMALIDSKKSAE